MQELFRWSLITAFIVSLVTFVLNLLGGRAWLQWAIMLAITLFALIRSMQKYGVPDSAFQNGGIMMLAALAGFLIGSSVQEVLEYVIILVLFVAAYFIGGLIAGRVQPKPKEEERDDRAENSGTEER